MSENELAQRYVESILSKLDDIAIKLFNIDDYYNDETICENIEASLTFLRGLNACALILHEELKPRDSESVDR
jgi:hypothetical protein